MTNQDYIRKAVELADDFDLSEKKGYCASFSFGVHVSDCLDDEPALDALAAQLVRQRYSHIVGTRLSHQEIHYSDDPITTIKAIVDSGVLK